MPARAKTIYQTFRDPRPPLLASLDMLLTPHAGPKVGGFLETLEKVNQMLKDRGEPELTKDELIGIRMYTGPMYEKYNTVLRAFSGHPFMVKKRDELCGSNMYTTTLHVINSALIKLG